MASNTLLKVAFIEAGKKQIAVAAKLGMNNNRLSQIVNGWREATDDEKRALAKELRKSVAQLFPEVAA